MTRLIIKAVMVKQNKGIKHASVVKVNMIKTERKEKRKQRMFKIFTKNKSPEFKFTVIIYLHCYTN